MINFNAVPFSLRDPGAYIEIAAGPPQRLPVMPNNSIMFGQMLAGGTAQPNVVIQVYSPAQAIQLFGLGSMLARMCAKWLKTNPNTPLFVCPQQDNGAGTAAVTTITCSGPATAAGTQAYYIDGTQIQFPVTVGMTGAQIAAALQAELAATAGLPISSANPGGAPTTVVCTCLHKGLDAGALDFRSTYYASDSNVAGVGFAVASTTAGAGNPSLTAAIAALTQWYLWWCNPYADGASLAAIYAAQEANWLPTVMRDSISFFSQKLSFGSAATEGEAQNEKLACYLPAQNMPEAPYLWAAWVTAMAANFFGLPFRPYTDLSAPGTLMAPAPADRWIASERNMLNFDGVATYGVNDAGDVTIRRLVTTYINNAEGVPDTTFLDVPDVVRAAYLRYSLRVFLASTFPRYNIADDGTPVTVGSATTTPSSIAGAIVGLAGQWQKAGLITDLDNFIAGLVVERNATDSTRVDILLPITPTKGLYTEAGQIQLQA
jgi:phage tail sheath gpL-like